MGLVLARALDQYSRTGQLPDTPLWARLAARQVTNPAAFELRAPILRGLLQPAQTVGLMPTTPYWSELRMRYDLNAARFMHYHPFLGRLMERDALVRQAPAQATTTTWPDAESPAPLASGTGDGSRGGGDPSAPGSVPAPAPVSPIGGGGLPLAGGFPGVDGGIVGGSATGSATVATQPFQAVPEPPGALLGTLGLAFGLGLLMARSLVSQRPGLRLRAGDRAV